MPDRLPALIFDLDGTILDSKPGILGCLDKVLLALGVNANGSMDRFIGPPVEEWAIELLPKGSEEDRKTLVRNYRTCYDVEGWKNTSVYAGVRELLKQLHDGGIPLYVCTSKRLDFALRILDALELTSMFTGIYADKAEYASHSKVDLLAMLLRERSLPTDSAWMIGDRIFDFEAAHANEIRCMAAGWGYGPESETLLADAVADTPADIPALLGLPQSQQNCRRENLLSATLLALK